MKIFDKIKNLFEKTEVCPKCHDATGGERLCFNCREYNRIIEKQKKREAEAKEDLKRRNWIRIRDEFLETEDGSD